MNSAGRTARIAGHYLKAMSLSARIRTRDALLRWQQERLKYFFETTLSRSPFYRGYRYEDFSSIPVITKKDMLAHFDDMNTAGLKKADLMESALAAEQSRDFSPTLNGYTAGLSSGTSGMRGLFVTSAREQEQWAGLMLARSIGAAIIKPHKVALFLRANNNLYETLNSGKHITFHYFDITLPIEAHLERLQALAPDILTAPASVLRYIAQLQREKVISLSPRLLFSAAEVLDPMDQDYIEQAFNTRVRQIYQCTEGFLGISDRHGNLLLNEDYLLIEKDYIDADSGRFVPIITDFSRTTQPIVRYRLDDVLIENRDYQGTRTVLSAIEGRCDDVLYGSKGDRLIPIYADTLRQTLLSAGFPYTDYQLIQHDSASLTLHIAPQPTQQQEQALQRSFAKLWARFSLPPPTLTLSSLHFSPGPHKLRRIIRAWNITERKSA